MFRVLIVLACVYARGLAMRSIVDALNDLNATQFLKIAQDLNDQKVLGGASDGPYTILVPTDNAFAKLGSAEMDMLTNTPGKLEEVVGVHFIRGELFSWDFRNGKVIASYNGHFVRVYQPNVNTTYLNDAKVLRFDEEADGAVIILIDTVLDAPEGTIAQVLNKPEFGLTMLADLVAKVHLNTTLDNSVGPYTVFAPSQAAFDRLTDVIKEELNMNLNMARHVVEYHVHPGTLHVKSLDRNGTLSTLYRGHNIGVSVIDDIKLNSVAGFEEVDIDCDNGVIHIIDHVLLPSSFGAIIG